MITSRSVSFIIIALLAGGILGYTFGTSKQAPERDIVSGGLRVTADSLTNHVIYQNDRYLFRLQLPNSVVYSSIASEKGVVFGARFASPNADMSEQRNRNTPNGFNTSSYNTLGLLVYENPKKLQPQNESEVRAWLTSVGKSGIQEFEQSTISGTPIIRTEEVDGIGSIGVNYYLFGPKFIYAFGTDDFPEEAMEQYLSGFSILGRL